MRVLLLLLVALVGPAQADDRAPCADHDPLRRPLFGDLHVHTGWSFDAWNADVRVTPEEAYAYARGQEVRLPPLDAAGEGTLAVVNDRPLDFAAVTDHAEFMGEQSLCSDELSPSYYTEMCQAIRDATQPSNSPLGFKIMTNIARITSIRLRRMHEIYADAGVALQLYANAYSNSRR